MARLFRALGWTLIVAGMLVSHETSRLSYVFLTIAGSLILFTGYNRDLSSIKINVEGVTKKTVLTRLVWTGLIFAALMPFTLSRHSHITSMQNKIDILNIFVIYIFGVIFMYRRMKAALIEAGKWSS